MGNKNSKKGHPAPSPNAILSVVVLLPSLRQKYTKILLGKSFVLSANELTTQYFKTKVPKILKNFVG